jgi:hypothetical protein
MQLENMRKVTVSRREDELPKTIYELHKLRISVHETKTMAKKER